jgi:hypothetical protein
LRMPARFGRGGGREQSEAQSEGGDHGYRCSKRPNQARSILSLMGSPSLTRPDRWRLS